MTGLEEDANMEEIEEYHMVVNPMFASEKQSYKHYNRALREQKN